MNDRLRVAATALMSSVLLAAFAQPALPADAKLADQAYAVLKSRCYRCHGGAASNAGVNVLKLENLTQVRDAGEVKFQFLVPGKSQDSKLWDVMAGDHPYMPLDGSPEAEAMTADERQLIKTWIEAGAPFPQPPDRKFVSEKDVLQAVREFLLRSPADDRAFLRFYTFAHLHNNVDLTDFDLRLYRAALAKVVASLTRERELVLPREVPGAEGTVYVIDLRRVGWDKRQLWLETLKEYPYGLKYDSVKDPEMRQAAQDVLLLSGGDLPYVRADWFVVTASRPPLYHTLLGIPAKLSELESQLGIDFVENFQRGTLARAGFAKSGISRQNRLLERHSSANTPYYWRSYDFRPRKAKGDLVRFPVGPKFDGNPFEKQAFEHDGGEMIFSLPNGMQAYMLVDADGERIDEGPVDIVYDRSATLGSPAIVNGISCMHCHRHGINGGFRDEIRGAEAVAGAVQGKVFQLHPPQEAMDRLVERDKELFLRALDRVVGPFLKVGDDKAKPIESFPEPVGKVAEVYTRDLAPHEVALELGIENVELLKAKIGANRELLKLGLGTIAQEKPGPLKREKWEAVDGTSLFQEVAAELRLGTPVVVGGATPQ
jgi:serine/threonine-protein kinase